QPSATTAPLLLDQTGAEPLREPAHGDLDPLEFLAGEVVEGTRTGRALRLPGELRPRPHVLARRLLHGPELGGELARDEARRPLGKSPIAELPLQGLEFGPRARGARGREQPAREEARLERGSRPREVELEGGPAEERGEGRAVPREERPRKGRHPLRELGELGHEPLAFLAFEEPLLLDASGETPIELLGEAVGGGEEEIENAVEGLSIPRPLDERGRERGVDDLSRLEAHLSQGEGGVLHLAGGDP